MSMELDPSPEADFDRYNRAVERLGILRRSLSEAHMRATPRDPLEAEIHSQGIIERQKAIEITNQHIEELTHQSKQYAAQYLPHLIEQARKDMAEDFYYRGELKE